MKSRRYVPLLAMLVLGLFVTFGYAKKGGVHGGGGGTANYIPTVATVSDQAQGVSSDSNGPYSNGVDGVQCYISVSKNDADLVTYNTPRMLHFQFPAGDPAVEAAKISSTLDAVVDIFAINYYGNYDSMGVGTTAQVQMDLEFYVGNVTYELDYAALAVFRYDENIWLITSDPNDIPYSPIAYGPEAKLNVIRRHRQTTFGVVSMPLRIWMVRQ